MYYFIKRISILFIISMLTSSLYAQYGDQLINRGFEEWTNRDSEPVHWHSNGTASGFFSYMLPDDQIEQSGHARPGSSGSKSVRLIPKTVWGVTANGNLTNGKMNAGSTSASGSDNYNQTKRGESAFNMPLSMLPDSLTIWVCFRSNSTSTKAQVKAVVHGNADYKIMANGSEDPANMHVATAALSFNRTSTSGGSYTWRRLSIPFNNNGPCTDVRYVLMTTTTNETPGSGSTDDDLFIDDALLVYNPTLTMGNLASTSFAPGNAVTIPFTLTGTMSPDNLNATANAVIAQMSDANGSFSNPTELGRVTTNTSGNITSQIPNVANGQYQIRVISTNYPMIGQNAQQVTITVPSYTIAVNANPTDGGTVTGGGEYTSGQSCTVAATANTGYTFTNWTEGGNVASTNASYTFNVTGNRTLVANFALNTYSITATADPTAGGTVTGAGTYNHGASCTLTATANTGYTFVNWTKNGTQVSTNASYTFTVSEAGSYVAHFSLNSYNVTATANPTAGGTVSGAGEYNHGASCTLTATANTGYTFTNWTENGSVVSSNANYTFTVTGNRTLVANFTLNTYTIATAANPAAGGTVSGAGEYNHGESCTVTATANTGYTFSNWTENGTVVSTNSSYTFTVEGNRNLVANFSNITYTITVSANPSNSGTATGGGTYNHGQSCTVIATSADGYTFTNWTENGSVVSTNANYTFTVTGDRALVANFEEQAPDTYNINVSPNPNVGGTVTGGGNYMEGEQCTVTATANNGYTFVKWTENGNQVSTDASYTFTVAGNRTLVAEFQIQSYTISAAVNPSNSGVITGVGDYEYGQSCTLVATANEGYTFTNWTEDGNVVSTNANYIFTVSGSRELIANFSTNAYTITATADPMEGGTVTGSGNYEYGATCTLTATANYEYTFVKWTKNGEEVSTDATFTFTVTASEDYVAHFDGPDAIEEVTIECQIFPNPFTSMVNIKAEKALKTVSVYDIYGRLLKEQKVSDMEIELDMSDLSNGAYLLKLDYGDSSSVHRIMKVRK